MSVSCPTGGSWTYDVYNAMHGYSEVITIDIVFRYENTIIGQFNGHTHTDEFRMYYDEETLTRPVGVAYVGGAVTTFDASNPNYRIYTMDGFYKNSSFVSTP